MMADATAGGKVEHEERHQKKIRESVDALLGAVSDADRILLVQKEVEGLSLKELEKIYNVNENALKVRLFRARQRVLKNMKDVTHPSSRIAKKTDRIP